MSTRPKPGIYDVARAAKVSIATVSRVLNRQAGVAEQTRQRVLAAMQRLGYRPHALARGLAARRSQTIGLVITDILDPYFAEIIRGAQEEAEAAGYVILLGDTSVHAHREDLLVRRLTERRIDALIVASSRTTRAYAKLVTSLEVPVLCINGQRQFFPHSVQIDNRAGARLAVEHLVRLGHRRIAHVAGPPGVPTRQERLAGYRAALMEAGIAYDPGLVVAGTGDLTGGRDAASRLLARAEPPTAIFAYNDRSAIGCYQVIRERGLRIPADVSVVGFDDIVMARWISPALTTVAQPRAEMGHLAVNLLLAMLRGESAPAQVVVMPHLAERASTAPPAEDASAGAWSQAMTR